MPLEWSELLPSGGRRRFALGLQWLRQVLSAATAVACTGALGCRVLPLLQVSRVSGALKCRRRYEQSRVRWTSSHSLDVTRRLKGYRLRAVHARPTCVTTHKRASVHCDQVPQATTALVISGS